MNVTLTLGLFSTGEYPSEDQGTKSCFGIPDSVKSSPSAKAVWKIELHKNSSPPTGMLMLTITPPATTPIGQYTLSVQHTDQEMLLATLVVLFNPWCPGRSVCLINHYQTTMRYNTIRCFIDPRRKFTCYSKDEQ